MRKKKAIISVVLIILAVLIVSAAVICVKQKNNIQAVVNAQKMSTEEIEQQISKTQEEIQESLVKYDLPIVRDFTEDEEKKIMSGEITPEQAVELLMGGQESAQSDENTQAQAADNNSAIIGEKVAQMYSLKAYYLGKIGTLVQEAKAEYKSGTSASAIIKSKMSEGVALEKECDAKVYSVIGEIEAAGADSEFVQTLKDAYEKEKGLKKSYYISQLK